MINRKRTWLVAASAGAVALASLLAAQRGADADCQRTCAPGTPKDAKGCCKAVAKGPSAKPAPSAAPSAPTCPEGMALIPGGTYTTGELKKTVTITAFCLDRTEVTVDAYTACVASGACTATRLKDLSGAACNYRAPGREKHPIDCVDWGQSTTYCGAQAKRLPTEYEWEWAARGATKGTVYPWGNEAPEAQLCWSGLSTRSGTCAVSSFVLGNSPQGVSDLAGNVWEWTSSKSDEEIDADDSRVFRGGSYQTEAPKLMTAALRFADVGPLVTVADVGFRCARSP